MEWRSCVGGNKGKERESESESYEGTLVKDRPPLKKMLFPGEDITAVLPPPLKKKNIYIYICILRPTDWPQFRPPAGQETNFFFKGGLRYNTQDVDLLTAGPMFTASAISSPTRLSLAD